MAFLSFNESFNANLKFTTDGADESDDMLKKDLPLRYTWSIWEQIMQSNDKSSAYSDATHKVAGFSTVQSFWKLWNHMPQPSELLEQKRMVREQPDGLHVIDAVMIFRESIRPEWEVLGLDRGSSKEAIRKRFRELAATEHPDTRPPGERAEADRRFTEITAAYQELMSGEVSDWRPEPVEIELEEPDGDSLVVVLAILLWLLVFVALAVGQDSLSWEGPKQSGLSTRPCDKMNAQGGHFQFQLKPNIGGGQVDEYWNNLVLGMIGATIEPANMITGLRLVDKLSGPRAAGVIRLEVWFTNYDDSAAVQVLKKNVEKCMATRLDGSVGTSPKCDVKSHSTSGKH